MWSTCSGEVDTVARGGVEVLTDCASSVGPVVVWVPLSVHNEILECVLWLPDKDWDGPATGEGVGSSATELSEYVPVRGVKLTVESAGHGISVDVHYSMVGFEDGSGVWWVTLPVPV